MKTFRKFLSLILSIFTVLPFVTACDEQATIGIIGGADGPTAILVSGFGENQPETDENLPETDETESAESESDTTETESETTEPDEVTLDIDGIYDSRDDVALYLHIYGYLPKNYITKAEAKALGWEGGSVEKYAPGKCIGGSSFGNYEGLLPQDEEYYECDINTLGKSSRGAERLVYTDDGYIYYTGDHYESFDMLYEGGGEE